MNDLQLRPSSPVLDTHLFPPGPEVTLSGLSRWVCTRCGEHVVQTLLLVYGPAARSKCWAQSAAEGDQNPV